jgi:NDP-sugar pyrophosphorylase family protein
MFPAWANEGCVHGFRCTGRFLDIGTPESYAEAETFFRAA